MSILISGAGGQVGRELVSRTNGRPVVAVDRQALDITDAAAIDRIFETARPQLVINAAAYTAVDKAESDVKTAFAINREGPRLLASACNMARIPLFHLSTDYVFDGSAIDAYLEDAPAMPLGVYGQSKWEGEEAVRTVLPEHLIIRVAWVFGAYGNNFIRTMLRFGRERPELRVVADQRGAPTHAGAIAETLLMLADTVLSGKPLVWGTYHYTGEPVTTWHQFAETIFFEAHRCGLLEKLPVVTAITTADYPTPAQRPANSALASTTAFERLGITRRPWIEGLREVLETWKVQPKT